MRSSLALAGAAAALMAVGTVMPDGKAAAHHSMAMFDQDREITLRGTVREFQWSNPHAYIQLVAENNAGQTQEWSLEMGAPMYLYARGWRPSTLTPGTRISVKAYPLRNGRPGAVVLEVMDADGNKIGRD